MNFSVFTNSNVIENLGWTLFHSLWQIALVWLILFLILKILPNISAEKRYLVSLSAFCLAVILPLATFVYLTKNPASEIFQNTISGDRNAERFENILTGEQKIQPPIRDENQTAIEQPQIVSVAKAQTFFRENVSHILPFAVGFWILGVIVFSLRLTGGILQVRKYKTFETSEPTDEWKERFSKLCESLKIARKIELIRSDFANTPMTVGWLKPLIIVPASVFLQISPKELETVLAHELVHIRRYDFLVNFAQTIAEILFFYHPCLWWISTVIRREREFACDDAVMKIFENGRIVYASALANLETIRFTQTSPPRIAAAANGGNLMQRIQRILQKNTEKKRSASAWSAIVALALISAFLLTIFSSNRASFVNAQTRTKSKKLAIGFVSIPPVDRTANAPKDSDATARLLIEKLKSHNVPAIGFVNGNSISDGEKLYPVRADIVRLWRDAGFEIGIGGYKHIWFHDTPFEEYVANAEKNERVTKQILAEKNLPLRYFSYPFLNTGKTIEDKNKFEEWLKNRNLTSVKYTIDNSEWLYSFAYDMARNDNDVSAMNEIRAAFIQYMTKMFDHYEAYSAEMFGRDINQTMVLTPSRLVADSADEIFGMIEKRGYKYVSMDEAQKDEAYATTENFAGIKAGISWFERWQMAQGKRLREEPKVDDFVQKIWDENRPKK